MIERARHPGRIPRKERRVILKKMLVISVFVVLAVLRVPLLFAQFTPEELALRGQWEEFLKTAEIASSEQITGGEAVTSPWILTFKQGDTTHRGLWKNARGRMGGYVEGWQYEIAAYLFDKLVGVN